MIPPLPNLTLLHLYPDEMNLYGDRGNLLALIHLYQTYGGTLKLLRGQAGSWQDEWNDADLVFMGGGQDAQQLGVVEDLHRHKASCLRSMTEESVVMLGICGGYQFMGNYYKPHNGPELKGLELIDAYTVAGSKRFIGNVVITPEASLNLETDELVGFENHSGLTYLGKDVKPLGRVTIGSGNNGQDHTEGVAHGHLFGTYLHGSLLPKNPALTLHLLNCCLRRKGLPVLPTQVLCIEQMAHTARREAVEVAKQKQNR
jgi:lipid II isoglutaminyl synthase (glutamine-hydrolysing)